MSEQTNFSLALWSKFMDMLYSDKAIPIPTTFVDRCNAVQNLLLNDVTGVIATVLDYAVESAAEASYTIECNNDNVESLLNYWLESVNEDLLGKIPTGVKPIALEYFKERWEGSSLCVLRVKDWKEVEFKGQKLLLPKAMYIVNGSSVSIDRVDEDNYKLGSDKYFLDKEKTILIPSNKNENIIVQKPYSRLFEKYPVPYIIRKGIYKNYKTIQILQDKGDEVITKIMPYLFVLKKGTENLALQMKTDYTDEDMAKFQTYFKDAIDSYKQEKNKMPTYATPFDTELQHLMPDFSNMVKEELFRQGNRALLSGLGFIDIVQGVSSARKESVLSPKPFIADINSGVSDFGTMLSDVAKLIINKNKEAHPKFFGTNNKIEIVTSPLKINIEPIMDLVRSGYDRGVVSKRTFIETLGFDYTQEQRRRTKELDIGDEDLFYPPLIQNQEATPDRVVPSKPKTDKEVNPDRKPGTPEANNFKNAQVIGEPIDPEVTTEIAPYQTNKDIPEHLHYLPEGAKDAFRVTFNEVMKEGKGEDAAFPIAYNSAKRWLKKNGYKKNDKGKWVKE